MGAVEYLEDTPDVTGYHTDQEGSRVNYLAYSSL